MSLFSFLRKNKQESTSGETAFQTSAEKSSGATRSRTRRRLGTEDASTAHAVDPVLPEKKRARRRLIGAVALVLAAIIGLPMIFESEPKHSVDDIAIYIPSKEKPVSTGAPQENRSADSKVPAATSLDPKEEVVEAAEAPASSKDKKSFDNIERTPGNDIAPATPATIKSKNNETAKSAGNNEKATNEKATNERTTVVSKPEKVETHSSKADTQLKSEVLPTEKLEEAARAKAILEGKEESKLAKDQKQGKFVIQVAALATKEKVDELQSKLKEAGIKSYTQTVATDSGERIRIRVGPFNSKDESDKMQAKIVKLGLNGTVIPLE